MKKFKKYVAVFFAVILLISILSGCYKKDENEAKFITESYSKKTTVTEEIKITSKAPKHNLVDEKTLTVAVSAPFEPMIYRENGKMQGFDAELVNLIANHLGYDVNFIEVEYEAITNTVSSGRSDIAIGAIDDDIEKNGTLFSEVYTSIECVIESGIEIFNYIIVINPKTNLYDDINAQIRQFKNDGTLEKLSVKYGTNKIMDFYNILPKHIDTQGKDIAVQGIKEIKLKANQINQHLVLSNSEENPCFLKFMIYIDRNQNGVQDDTDELIIETSMIPPGFSVTTVESKKGLTESNYAAVVIVHTYSYDAEMRPLNTFNMKSTLVVE